MAEIMRRPTTRSGRSRSSHEFRYGYQAAVADYLLTQLPVAFNA
jgi:hypothetical protein